MSHLRIKCTKFDSWRLSVCLFVCLCLRWSFTLTIYCTISALSQPSDIYQPRQFDRPVHLTPGRRSDQSPRVGVIDGGLFRRVILHGGTALTSWSLSQDPLRYTRRLAEAVNCSSPSSLPVDAAVLRCLKRLPVEHIVEKARLISAPRFRFLCSRKSSSSRTLARVRYSLWQRRN